MLVKQFNESGEYIGDIDFNEFSKTNKIYSCNTEQYIVKDINKLVNKWKKNHLSYENIVTLCLTMYRLHNWSNIMYEDRLIYFIEQCYNENL